jgi:formate--tetrahydrofolate ligase
VPAVAVVVATIRALKMHGGVALTELPVEDVAAVRRGCDNLAKHIDNVRLFGLAPVVALNHFTGDTDAEVAAVLEACRAWGVPAEVSRGWEAGGGGTTELAQTVLDTIKGADRTAFRLLYPDEMPLEEKIETIATRVYGADGVRFAPAAAQKLARWQTMGHGRLPVCMAKTQNSLSDDPKKIGRPRGFTITVRDARLCAGAGFVVAYAGDVLTMPGLPKVPGAEGMDVDAAGNITGLF